MEIPVYGSAKDLLQDIDDSVSSVIGNDVLIFIEPLPMVSGTLDAIVDFELIDADSFGSPR